MTDKAKETDITQVIGELENEANDDIKEYYGILLSLIAEKNPDIFAEIREEKDMKYKYPGLMKVFAEDVNEQVRAKEQETLVSSIKNLMTNLKLTLEQAMDALSIPQSDRATYTELICKKPLETQENCTQYDFAVLQPEACTKFYCHIFRCQDNDMCTHWIFVWKPFRLSDKIA